jgi:hypothetical protein
MARSYGSAQNERDLLDKINTFVTTDAGLVAAGEQWRTVHTSTQPATATNPERVFYAWSAPGTGADEIFITCQSGGVFASDIYQLFFSGGVNFEPSLSTIEKPLDGLRNPTPNAVGIHCDGAPFNYWLYANGRRLIVVTRINRVYSSAYVGFMLPQLPSNEYPYPLVIAGGTDDQFRRYSEDSDYTASITDPRAKNFWLLYPNLGWRDFYGQKLTESSVVEALNRYITPAGSTRVYSRVNSLMIQLGESPVTGHPLLPVEMIAKETAAMGGLAYWGMLEGVYWVPGISRGAEDIVNLIDGRTALVFQNGFRTSTKDYWGVIEE